MLSVYPTVKYNCFKRYFKNNLNLFKSITAENTLKLYNKKTILFMQLYFSCNIHFINF